MARTLLLSFLCLLGCTADQDIVLPDRPLTPTQETALYSGNSYAILLQISSCPAPGRMTMRVVDGVARTSFYQLIGQIQPDGSFILRNTKQLVLRAEGRIEGNTVRATITGHNCNYTIELLRQ